MEAVPQIKEVVPQPETVVVIESDSESDTEGGDSQANVEEDKAVVRPAKPPAAVRYCVNPAHVKSLEEDEKDTAHSPDDLTWEDKAVDVAVDELVRLIKEDYTFKNTMFVGSLTAADLVRIERKQKDKETKERKERENQPDSPDTDASDTGDQNQMARNVASLLKPLINDSFSNESERLEVKLEAVIQDEVQKMQGAVIQSIIDFLGKSNSANKAGEENPCGPQESRPNPSSPTDNAPRREGKETSPEKGTTDEITNTETANTTELTARTVDETNANNIINDVVFDVQSLGNFKEIQTPPHAHPTVHEEESSEDDEVWSPIIDLNENVTNSIEFLLSLIEIPTFSLGLSQEDVGPLNDVQPPMISEGICETRKSKRTRTLPPIFNNYQCDPKIKSFRTEDNAARQDHNVKEDYLSMRDSARQNKVFTVGNGISLSTKELNCIVDLTQQMPPKVMDVLIHYISLDRSWKRTLTSTPKIAFYDTNFPASLMNHYGKFTKTAVKDRCRIKYDNSGEDTYDRIYFPFYIDKQHWVGICIDMLENSVHVLDCNRGFRTESQIKKDINPITIVVPHILNYTMGQQSNNGRKPFALTRAKDIPQNNLTESAVTTVLLIQAHTLNGIDGCKEVKQASLAAAAKNLAVLFYRDINPV
ncbi:hypothetical protein Bca52824_082697 [Brassica carinata]|uniref:Ubiquitin-like protease family profile domain-containing protein n=1 Tax=Brassica carinata TaxID=52824 RepID=A0A8X7TUI8_BRACI|nr:hypothetical protein Bca52824_082697 [Brassica carinata]